MKKTYFIPSMEIVEIHTTQVLTSSPTYGGSTTETSGNLAPELNDLEFIY